MTESTTNAVEVTKSSYRTLLISKSAGVEFGIDLLESRGVTTAGRITPLPGTAPSVVGLTYFRGGIEAAIDLGVIWNLDKSSLTSARHTILVEAGGRRGVLCVESLTDLYDIAENEINSCQFGESLPGQVGWFEMQGRTIPFISADQLLLTIS